MRTWVHYAVQKRDGTFAPWITVKRGALFRKGPRTHKGQIKLGNGTYTVNTSNDMRRVNNRFWWSPWPLEEQIYRFFVEGFPVQMPPYVRFVKAKQLDDMIHYTADQVSEWGASRLPREYLHPNLNWGMLFLALLGGLGIGAIVMSFVQRIK